MKSTSKSNLSALMLAASMSIGAAVVTSPAAAAAAAAAEPAKPTVSKAVVKQLADAQKAGQAKKFDEALAKLAEAEAITTRTPYDTFVMHQLRAYTYSQMGRTNDAIPSYIAELDSGFLSADEQDRISRGVTTLYYQQKDYAKTTEFGQKVIAAGRADADAYFMIGHAYYLQDKYPEAIGIAKAYLAEAAKKGQKPSENSLLLLTQASAKQRDIPGLTDSLGLLVEHYGKPDYWRDLLVTLRDNTGRGANNDVYTFNIYRLMRETSTLRESNDFLEMAQLAVQLGSPGEAVDALTRGQKAAVFTAESDKSASRNQLQSAGKLAESDRAGLAKFEIEAKAAKAGEGDVRLGQTYLSYDQPDKALEALQRGIAKGSLRNADEAQILLGISLLRLGRKDEAAAAFKATKGTDARLGNLARLWGIHARA